MHSLPDNTSVEHCTNIEDDNNNVPVEATARDTSMVPGSPSNDAEELVAACLTDLQENTDSSESAKYLPSVHYSHCVVYVSNLHYMLCLHRGRL